MTFESRMLIMTSCGLVGFQHFREIYGPYLQPSGNHLHPEDGDNTFLWNVGTHL